MQAAYAIMANPHRLQLEDDRSFYMPFCMLCGFAAELYFKSYLLQKGYTEGDLRKRLLGHDLSQLGELAIKNGLCAPTASLVGWFGKHHKNFAYRYAQDETLFGLPRLSAVFSAFSSLDFQIDTAVGASVSKGLVPRDGWTFPADGDFWRIGHLRLAGDC